MTKETALPDLVGTLANLPEHIQATIGSYGAACARTALQSPEVKRLREDAARYRYLKMDAPTPEPRDIHAQIAKAKKLVEAYEIFCTSWVDWDTAIDAAMEKHP